MSTTLTPKIVEHIFESLRSGLVPERGIEAFAVGVDKPRGELERLLKLAKDQEGGVKFLRGGYGCGKTFMARLALVDAQRAGFATSFVVVSDNDLQFHKFDDVYRRVMSELSTATCSRGALNDILDRWIGRIEEALIDAGADENAADFDERVRTRLQQDLTSMTGGRAPADFVRVIQTVFDLKQKGDLTGAGALVSWLCGSGNVSSAAKKAAQIKGDIGSRDALEYLRGALEIVKAAGFKGLLIVIDEAETILRMRSDSRHKSLNGIRQILDASGSYPGLLWVFTGTPEFFDARRGVAGLQPLHDRIKFSREGGFASLRQPQIELTPFDAVRLEAVALRLRELYPMPDRTRLEEKISSAFIRRLVEQVTAGFRGDVGVVPRQFLRRFVMCMDLVDENPDFDPMTAGGFEPEDLRDEEKVARSGGAKPGPVDADEDEPANGVIPAVDQW